MSSLPKFRPAPLPNLCQFLDFNAAGPLTRPECGAGDESTPSGATGARESVHYVSRRSSWTPLLARLGGLLEVFSVMSTQLSAHIDSWILSLVFGNLLFVYGKLSFCALCNRPFRSECGADGESFQTPVGGMAQLLFLPIFS